MDKAEYGIGNVQIVIDGEEFFLKPTLKACMNLSRIAGGITLLNQKCVSYDFDTILQIIKEGLGVNSKDLAEKVWKTGLINLAVPCIRFLHVLANGGRPLDEVEEEKTEEKKMN